MSSSSKMYELEERLSSMNNYLNTLSDSVKGNLQSKVMEAHLNRQRMAAMSVVAKSQLMLAELDVLIAENSVYEKMVQSTSKRFKADEDKRRGHSSSSGRKSSGSQSSSKSSESKSNSKSKKPSESRSIKYKKDCNRKDSKSHKSSYKSSNTTRKSVKDSGCGPSFGSDVIMKDLSPKVTAITEVTPTPILNPVPLNYDEFMNSLNQRVSQAMVQAPINVGGITFFDKQQANSVTLSKSQNIRVVPDMENNSAKKLQEIEISKGSAPLPNKETHVSPINSNSIQSSTVKNNETNIRKCIPFDDEDTLIISPVTEAANIPDSHKTAVNLFKTFKKIMPSQPKIVTPKIDEVFSIFDIDVGMTPNSDASVSNSVVKNVNKPEGSALKPVDIFKTANSKPKNQRRSRRNKQHKSVNKGDLNISTDSLVGHLFQDTDIVDYREVLRARRAACVTCGAAGGHMCLRCIRAVLEAS